MFVIATNHFEFITFYITWDTVDGPIKTYCANGKIN